MCTTGLASAELYGLQQHSNYWQRGTLFSAGKSSVMLRLCWLPSACFTDGIQVQAFPSLLTPGAWCGWSVPAPHPAGCWAGWYLCSQERLSALRLLFWLERSVALGFILKSIAIALVCTCTCWEGVLAAQEATVSTSACSSDPGAVTWIERKEITMENTVIYLLPSDSS